MTAAQAYSILEAIDEINVMKENLELVEPTAEDLVNEDEVEKLKQEKHLLNIQEWIGCLNRNL